MFWSIPLWYSLSYKNYSLLIIESRWSGSWILLIGKVTTWKNVFFTTEVISSLSLSILISTILHWFNTIRRFRCFLYDVVLININKNNPYLQKRGNICYDFKYPLRWKHKYVLSKLYLYVIIISVIYDLFKKRFHIPNIVTDKVPKIALSGTWNQD